MFAVVGRTEAQDAKKDEVDIDRVTVRVVNTTEGVVCLAWPPKDLMKFQYNAELNQLELVEELVQDLASGTPLHLVLLDAYKRGGGGGEFDSEEDRTEEVRQRYEEFVRNAHELLHGLKWPWHVCTHAPCVELNRSLNAPNVGTR